MTDVAREQDARFVTLYCGLSKEQKQKVLNQMESMIQNDRLTPLQKEQLERRLAAVKNRH